MKKYTREHPRIDAELPIRIRTAGGEIIHATTLNLSPAGLQLGCDGQTAGIICGGAAPAGPGPSVEVDVRLTLRAEEATPDDVEVRCRVAFARRIAERDFRVGLQYLDLSEESAQALQRYIEETQRYP